MESETQHVTNGRLKDFDWQLNLALSSDKLSSLNQSLVNVDFDLETKNSESTLRSLEMNNKELNMLVEALEQAHQALQQAK